jgi:hypothetical protein
MVVASIYLGTLYREDDRNAYFLKNIYEKNEWKREIQSIQEYWLAHRINHAMDGKVIFMLPMITS